MRFFAKDEKGQSMTEYILIVVLVAVAAITVMRLFGNQIKGMFQKSTETIQSETKDAFKK